MKDMITPHERLKYLRKNHMKRRIRDKRRLYKKSPCLKYDPPAVLLSLAMRALED